MERFRTPAYTRAGFSRHVAASHLATSGVQVEPTELARDEWAEALNPFTRRTAGRLSILATTDVNRSPRCVSRATPIFGVTYRAQDHGVEILLGERLYVGERCVAVRDDQHSRSP